MTVVNVGCGRQRPYAATHCCRHQHFALQTFPFLYCNFKIEFCWSSSFGLLNNNLEDYVSLDPLQVAWLRISFILDKRSGRCIGLRTDVSSSFRFVSASRIFVANLTFSKPVCLSQLALLSLIGAVHPVPLTSYWTSMGKNLEFQEQLFHMSAKQSKVLHYSYLLKRSSFCLFCFPLSTSLSLISTFSCSSSLKPPQPIPQEETNRHSIVEIAI